MLVQTLLNTSKYYFTLEQKQDESRIESEDIVGTAAFEISQLLLDESDNNTEFANENETTNLLPINFPDLQYILNQKLVPQNQFENFDQLFTLEGFLCPKILINIRKNHDAFSRHSKKISSNNQTSTTGLLNLNNNANRLISEFTNNSIQENRVNRRKDCWEGCKRLATIPIASGTNSKYLLLVL